MLDDKGNKFVYMEYDYSKPSNNALIVKGDVGLAKPFTHDLPGLSHTYGRSSPTDPYGAKALCTTWEVS